MSHEGVSEADIAAAREQFDEGEVVRLLYVITVINAWNRLSIAAGVPSGTYKPAQRSTGG